MKTPFLDMPVLEKTFYPNGNIRSEKYMVHMAYIVFYYDEEGNPSRVVVNGTEYPPSVQFSFKGNELEIKAD